MLLGVAALAAATSLPSGGADAAAGAGAAAVLYYLSGYLFTVLAAFTVICVVMRQVEGEDVTALTGLSQRSPLLAAALSLAMVSLAGIPPMAGFFGKFLLFKAALAQRAVDSAYGWLVAIAITGVVISIYYYFGVVRSVFWPGQAADLRPIQLSLLTRLSLCACIAGMFLLGLYPAPVVRLAEEAVKILR
jgi:NADH-quinone oxidoreductase subunit N